ncbi:hypothetical protein KKB71_00525 [Patescibacteria group bacterium]|nr:hypothetical protein [Patescibacteria group bacterium]MBU2219039.1 hypothetical protein [Patescibacteria group bacterium]MBU2263612.1 hypothetical protein [Patescibacteria group bacterium]
MISIEKFLEIFKNTDFPRKKRVRFYHSIKKSVVLCEVGRKAMDLLLKIEEKDQWPILKEIDDPELDIYKDADQVLLNEFINSIKDEKELRSEGKIRDRVCKKDAWLILRILVQARTELYKNIFSFSKKDLERCKKSTIRFERIFNKKRKERLLKTGIGVVALGAAAAGAYLLTKKSKDKKENKKGKIVEGKIKIRK